MSDLCFLLNFLRDGKLCGIDLLNEIKCILYLCFLNKVKVIHQLLTWQWLECCQGAASRTGLLKPTWKLELSMTTSF